MAWQHLFDVGWRELPTSGADPSFWLEGGNLPADVQPESWLLACAVGDGSKARHACSPSCSQITLTRN